MLPNKTERIGMTKKRIVVLMGGETHEREISLETGRNVCYKLLPSKYDVVPVFVREDMELFKMTTRLLVQNSTKEIADMVTEDLKIKWAQLPEICDFVFIALHGGKGEGGAVQGALEMLGLPYNGSGILASALCMDKYKTNSFLSEKGFSTPKEYLLSKKEWETNKKVDGFSFPLIVKPHDDGCSMFVERVNNQDELVIAVEKIFSKNKKHILIEEFLTGMELTCGVYGNEEIIAMPPSQAVSQGEILSIEEKFLPGAGENQTPAPLSEDILNFVKEEMKLAYKAVGCKGYGRIVCFYQTLEQSSTGEHRVVFLEFNSLPGLTPATCIFHQAAELGIKTTEFIDKIVELGFENHADATKSEMVNVSVGEKLKEAVK